MKQKTKSIIWIILSIPFLFISIVNIEHNFWLLMTIMWTIILIGNILIIKLQSTTKKEEG